MQYENIEDFMYSLLENYGLYAEEKKNQKNRIVILDLFTFKYIPFHISDILQFGHIDDLLDYWNVELSNKRLRRSEWLVSKANYRIIDEYTHQASEIYLGSKFAELKESEFNYDYKSYYDLLSRRFIIVDSRMIGFMWSKNTISGWQCSTNYVSKLNQTLLFKDWILLYQKKIDLEALENQFKEKIYQKRLQ